jgi:hypothetical protein
MKRLLVNEIRGRLSRGMVLLTLSEQEQRCVAASFAVTVN